MFSRRHPFFSFLSLSIIAGYCFYVFFMEKGFGSGNGITLEFPYGTYLFTTLHGIIGSLIYAKDSSDYTLWRWLYNTEIFIKTLSYPCFVTEIWLKYGVIQPEVAWIHAIVGAIPAALFIVDNRLKKNWIDVIVYLNTLSLIAICIQNVNYWGLAAGTAFTIGYYIQRKRSNFFQIEPDLWFNYFTSAFCCGAQLALSE